MDELLKLVFLAASPRIRRSRTCYEGIGHARTVEKYAASVLAGNQDIAGERRMLREFVFLDTFRQQFKQFLEAYGKMVQDGSPQITNVYAVIPSFSGCGI